MYLGTQLKRPAQERNDPANAHAAVLHATVRVLNHYYPGPVSQVWPVCAFWAFLSWAHFLGTNFP